MINLIFIILSIGFVNLIRYADLIDNTTVRTVVDYLKYSNYSTIKYNVILLSLVVIAFTLNQL